MSIHFKIAVGITAKLDPKTDDDTFLDYASFDIGNYNEFSRVVREITGSKIEHEGGVLIIPLSVGLNFLRRSFYYLRKRRKYDDSVIVAVGQFIKSIAKPTDVIMISWS